MSDALFADGKGDAVWPRIVALGASLDKEVIEASFRLIEPLHPPRSYDIIEEEHAYGPHARHRIDIFREREPGGTSKPILLFVHGGGYASGDKRMGPFFANLGRWAASAGLIGATMNYRLAPDHMWPCVQEDIRDAISWLRGHAAEIGADPERLILMGHSAGAGHCANYAVNPQFHAELGSGTAGMVLISGVYDLTLAGAFGRSSRSLYYGVGDATEAERSCLKGLANFAPPIAIFVAELDPPELHVQALAVLETQCSALGKLPSFTRLCGHNHYTEILSAGLPMATQMHHALLDFISLDCAAGANSARPIS
jgi:Esterase/lipase